MMFPLYDSMNGIAVGNNGEILKTNNGGKDWIYLFKWYRLSISFRI